jgi:hypothetical protein
VQRSFNQLNWEIYSRLSEFQFRDVQTFPSVVKKQFKVFHNVFHDAWKILKRREKATRFFSARCFSQHLDKFERREKAKVCHILNRREKAKVCHNVFHDAWKILNRREKQRFVIAVFTTLGKF